MLSKLYTLYYLESRHVRPCHIPDRRAKRSVEYLRCFTEFYFFQMEQNVEIVPSVIRACLKVLKYLPDFSKCFRKKAVPMPVISNTYERVATRSTCTNGTVHMHQPLRLRMTADEMTYKFLGCLKKRLETAVFHAIFR